MSEFMFERLHNGDILTQNVRIYNNRQCLVGAVRVGFVISKSVSLYSDCSITLTLERYNTNEGLHNSTILIKDMDEEIASSYGHGYFTFNFVEGVQLSHLTQRAQYHSFAGQGEDYQDYTLKITVINMSESLPDDTFIGIKYDTNNPNIYLSDSITGSMPPFDIQLYTYGD